jgi:hypothetical protein
MPGALFIEDPFHSVAIQNLVASVREDKGL